MCTQITWNIISILIQNTFPFCWLWCSQSTRHKEHKHDKRLHLQSERMSKIHVLFRRINFIKQFSYQKSRYTFNQIFRKIQTNDLYENTDRFYTVPRRINFTSSVLRVLYLFNLPFTFLSFCFICLSDYQFEIKWINKVFVYVNYYDWMF